MNVYTLDEIFIMEYSKCNESVKCCVCKLSNIKINFHRHLIDKHPEADPNDLFVYGQLKSNFGQVRKFVKEPSEAEPLYTGSYWSKKWLNY